MQSNNGKMKVTNRDTKKHVTILAGKRPSVASVIPNGATTKHTEDIVPAELINNIEEYVPEESEEFTQWHEDGEIEDEVDYEDYDKFDIESYFEHESIDDQDVIEATDTMKSSDLPVDGEKTDFLEGFTYRLPTIFQMYLMDESQSVKHMTSALKSIELERESDDDDENQLQQDASSVDQPHDLWGEQDNEEEAAEEAEEELYTETLEEDTSYSLLMELDMLPSYKYIDELAEADRRANTDLHYLDDPFGEVMAFEKATISQHRRYDTEDHPQVHIKTVIEQDVSNLLNELISTVVTLIDTAETAHNLAMLEKRMDKKRLIRLVCQKLNELMLERKYAEFIERVIAQHFVKRQMLAALSPEKDEFMKLHLRKYHKMLKRLDDVLNLEKTIAQKFESLKIESHKMYAEKSEEIVQKVDAFMENFKETIATKRKSVKLIEVFDHDFNLMLQEMQKIAELRLRLIKRHHLHLTLQAKIEQTHYLGEGHNLSDYQKLLSDVTVLELKLRDNMLELNQLHSRYTDLLHFKAHTSNYVESFRLRLRRKEELLQTLIAEQNETQIFFNQLIHQRAKLHKKKNEIHNDQLPIHKPFLLLDYDADMERYQKKNKVVKGLRQQLANGQAKLKKYLLQFGIYEDDISLMESTSASLNNSAKRSHFFAPLISLSNFNFDTDSSDSVGNITLMNKHLFPPSAMDGFRQSRKQSLQPKVKITKFNRIVQIFSKRFDTNIKRTNL